ncbi:MAG: hypothetical protein ACNS63_01910 [Candidatus Nitrospinota bacterium M3_3B_026]
MSVCVLISTSESYGWVAKLTGRMIGRFWPGHPPVYVCGLPGAKGDGIIPLRDDPRDWMGIHRSACGDLLKMGYTKLYLILDDHPPLARCHEEHLNGTLPALMDDLGAINISLNGWGQGRPLSGAVLGGAYYGMEKVSRGFRWKFQLHPALWDIESLAAVLDSAMDGLAPHERTPWIFERKTGGEGAGLPEGWMERSYRICGFKMSASRARVGLVHAERFAVAAAGFAAGRMFGRRVRDRFDDSTRFITRYYEGPYPVFWSGVLRKGTLNKDLVLRLKTHGPGFLLRELMKAYEARIAGADVLTQQQSEDTPDTPC